VTADGSVFRIGQNLHGQLGSSRLNSRDPTRIVELPPVSAVAVPVEFGEQCAFLLKNGQIANLHYREVNILMGHRPGGAFPINAVSFAIANQFGVAATVDGQVVTWARGAYGWRGHGGHELPKQPARFIDGINDAISVGCSTLRSAIVHRDGTVSVFEQEFKDAYHMGTNVTRGGPQKISGIFNAVAVACGETHMLIRHADGQVSVFGRGHEGQLGLGDITEVKTPTIVPGVGI
jgi:alpha-tubulin suppressor-like RCC1 family protein